LGGDSSDEASVLEGRLAMDSHREIDGHLVTPDMIKGLLRPVQRYMTYTGIVGHPWIDTVRLNQVGKFRQGAD
jgi:hypothetical protein